MANILKLAIERAEYEMKPKRIPKRTEAPKPIILFFKDMLVNSSNYNKVKSEYADDLNVKGLTSSVNVDSGSFLALLGLLAVLINKTLGSPIYDLFTF